jgi:hypothetical protein
MNMINATIFNEQQQANEISSGTSNSTQRYPKINNKVQKQMKLKHASACLELFSFFLLFSFLLNKWPLKISKLCNSSQR